MPRFEMNLPRADPKNDSPGPAGFFDSGISLCFSSL